MATSTDVRRFFRDLAMPLEEDEPLRTTSTGDLRTVEGRENLRSALQRRALVQPGSLVHRPEYGGGVVGHLESVNSPAAQARLANDLRRNLLQDRRVADARVAVSTGRPGAESSPHAVTIDVRVKPRGDDVAEQFSIQVPE